MGYKDNVKNGPSKLSLSGIGHAIKTIFTDDIELRPGHYRDGIEVDGNGDVFYPMGADATHRHFDGMNCKEYYRAYFECAPLAGIINRKAQSFTNGTPYLINTAGKAKDKEATGNIATKINNLLAKPNRLQSREEFEAQNYIYTQLFGYCIVLAMKPVGFPLYEATELWNIPPNLLEVLEKRGIFYTNKGSDFISIHLTYGGERVALPLDNIIVIRDLMPSFCSVALPESRVATLRMPINNIIGAYESRNMLINSRGALGMLTNQTQDAAGFINLKPDEKRNILRDFKQLYGLKKGQSHIIITSANLKWQSMVQPTKDLMLFEEIEDDGNRICDQYMFPAELFAKMNGGTTFSNIATATRNLYQDAIMPESKLIYSQWNMAFETAKFDLELGREYKNLPAMQAASKEEAEANLRKDQSCQIRFRNDIITKNEWRIEVGKEPIANGDVYYSEIKDELVPTVTAGADTTASGVNTDNTQTADNLNPQATGNDGTPGAQAQ